MTAGAGTTVRSGPPSGVSSLELVRYLAGPLSVEGIADASARSVARVEDSMTVLCQATGARSRVELVADYAWAGHLSPRDLGVGDLTAVYGLSAAMRLLLRLTAAGLSDRAVSHETGAIASTVCKRREALREALGVGSDHQAVGLGCLAGVVRRSDMPGRRFVHAVVPVPEHLRPLVARAQRHVASEGRALVVLPRSEQARLAAALAGGRCRVLVLTVPGEHWEHDLAVLADAHREAGQVLAVLDKAEAARLPLPPGVAAATRPRAVRAVVGTTLPAVLVATPAGLPALDRLHHDGWPPPDLAIALDGHLPATGRRIGRTDGRPPAALLHLTSIPRFTTTGRVDRDGCEPGVTGELTALLAQRQAAEAGLMRGYRLAAVATARSFRHMGPARLVADLTRVHGLRRVIVRTAGPADSVSLAKALGATGLAAEALPARGRARVLTWFSGAAPDTRVLVFDGPLPPWLGADALVHTHAAASTARTAAVVEAALTPAGPGEGPLLMVSADRADDTGWPVLAALTAAVAALDPHLRQDLAQARTGPTGHDGLEFPLPLPAGADERRARRVCAWADTTWEEEMTATAARAAAEGRPRRGVVSPSGRPLTSWTPSNAATRTHPA
ncbi:hypothetical protein ACFU7Y_06415 [Kitasatospora sp. NPDC057542]|uniref:hypothetical protein n=1 Tax=Kitasatospora sp. NPDC057542 TaxID=3346162 RepID=UPI00368510A8